MITSTANAKVKQLVNLQKKSRLRQEQGVFIVEGVRMFREVPKAKVRQVYVSESLYQNPQVMREKGVVLDGFPVEVLADHVFSHVSDTKSPQGILCVVEQFSYSIEEILSRRGKHLLVLDNLQDPGNLGTIFRTGEAAGVTAVLMSRDCVDIYNPQTIRSTMGSIYRLPFLHVEDILQTLDVVKRAGVQICAAHLGGTCDYDEVAYTGDVAILIGNEGNGLREEVAGKADTWVKIPMEGRVESLNAAIAASVLMFEVYRQRREKEKKK